METERGANHGVPRRGGRDASAEDERLRAFQQAFADHVELPSLEPSGTWDPGEEYWGEEGDAIDDWAQTIIAHGPRPEFEMEQVLPGADPNDPDVDPIIESNDLKDAGDLAGARRILMGVLEVDLRCLDAHAHLGNLVFDHTPQEALRHYEVGVRIGELSLGEDFTGVLGWGLVANRPFLCCLKGYGLPAVRDGRAWEESAS
jgi:hypothetical protein